MLDLKQQIGQLAKAEHCLVSATADYYKPPHCSFHLLLVTLKLCSEEKMLELQLDPALVESSKDGKNTAATLEAKLLQFGLTFGHLVGITTDTGFAPPPQYP